MRGVARRRHHTVAPPATMKTALNPNISLPALHFPDDLRVNPRALFHGLLPRLQSSLGCHYLPKTVATSAESHGDDCLVTTAAGARYRCRHAFVCTGSDFRTLFPTVFAQSGLKLCRLQMIDRKSVV